MVIKQWQKFQLSYQCTQLRNFRLQRQDAYPWFISGLTFHLEVYAPRDYVVYICVIEAILLSTPFSVFVCPVFLCPPLSLFLCAAVYHMSFSLHPLLFRHPSHNKWAGREKLTIYLTFFCIWIFIHYLLSQKTAKIEDCLYFPYSRQKVTFIIFAQSEGAYDYFLLSMYSK